MLSIEDKECKEFKIYDIFSNQRGKRQIEANRKKGNTPYYSASQLNNGLTDFISNPTFEINTNAIIYSTFGDAYYVEKDFSTSDEITVLTNSNLNKFNGLFICKVINQNKSKYSFGRKAYSNKIGKDKIILPVNKEGKPDYEYMEEYTKSLMNKKIEDYEKYTKKVLSNLEYKEIELLKNKEWKEFYLSGEEGIFTNYHGKRLIKEHRILGLTPLLTACENNNGISSFISNETMNKYKNCITIDMFGNSFYHNYFCSGDDNIYFFLNDDLCMFKKLFIVEMINKNKNKFSYGKQFRQKNADNFKILLPINEKNEPDYEYMEQYMKNMIYIKINQYLAYINKN